MAATKVSKNKVTSFVKELPKQRIVKVTPIVGSQEYLPNSIPANGTGLRYN